ncbi:MAG TPA: sigma-70 family RNA polymerase sigma factor [Anaerolineae bacterium]|nr:sigma-70 family RNA polymerase sigma factor [Anaerolineae bacterium]
MYQSDDDLIQACRKGDSRAWKIVVDKYKRLVFSIPLNYGLSQEDAADITQITFTILFKSLDQLYSNARLAPWLATVARRHSWRLLERYRRESVHSDEDLELGLADLITPDSVNDLEKWERLEWLDKGFSQLDKRCTQLLLLLYFSPEKPSYAEVAAWLNIPASSVSPIRARCLKRLKKFLGTRIY